MRSATTADIPAMLDVFFRADEDLRAGDGGAPRQRQPELITPYLEHLIGTDPATCVVAEHRASIVAYGMVMVRGATGFLSELFVLPEWQRHGLGRSVLAQCRRAAVVEHMATCTDAVQPISTGLYASLGLAPRIPIYILGGTLVQDRLPPLPEGVCARPLVPDRIAALDEAVLGYRRPDDHAVWSRLERQGWEFLGPAGEQLGYGYTHPSGRISPVLAGDPATLPAMLGYLARSLGGRQTYRSAVPGPAIEALRPLLAAGLRIDGAPAVYCADYDGPRFDRYIPMSTSLL